MFVITLVVLLVVIGAFGVVGPYELLLIAAVALATALTFRRLQVKNRRHGHA